MAQLSKLSKSQLETRIQETQAELNRRGTISKVTKDIVKILKKYNLTLDDIDFKTLVSIRKPNYKTKAAGSPSKQKKTRAKVAPKFKSLDADQKWTGRGKAPAWVVALCEEENLTIDAFKKDQRFKLQQIGLFKFCELANCLSNRCVDGCTACCLFRHADCSKPLNMLFEPSEKGAAIAENADTWYLLQLKLNTYQVRIRNLQRQSFHKFHSLHRVILRRYDRFIKKRRPFFPGYMFFGFDPDAAPWHKINQPVGVAKLVRFAEHPRAAPNDLIAELMQRCDSISVIHASEQLKIGDSMQLLSGAFANFIARIEHVDEEQRVWMLIDIMGQTTRLSARHEQLRVSRL